jgi:sulfate/thiosulfate transport system substrate-binding protein
MPRLAEHRKKLATMFFQGEHYMAVKAFSKALFAAAGVALCGLLAASGCGGNSNSAVSILNVSYDPTREFYKEYNEAFKAHWREVDGGALEINMSHGGSRKQAQSVISGLSAAVVTLALADDIDAIHREADLLPGDWQSRLPRNSCPYTSTIIFLVRKDNPKHIQDWDDLVKPDVQVITPNPKTSGGACWNYLAAWGYVLKRELGDLAKLKNAKTPEETAAIEKAQQAAQQFVAELYKHVPVLDTGARGSTNTFVNGTGDVLLAWENEAYLSVNDLGPDKFEFVVPRSGSILAEPPVSLIDKVVDKTNTRKVAEAYLEYLYSPEGQTLAAKHYYRPVYPERIPQDKQSYLDRFPKIELFTIDHVFGGWTKTQKTHFSAGGTFDQIYNPNNK